MEIKFRHYDSPESMPACERELVEAACTILQKAYAPYSHFHVGAAARLRSGEIVHAANVESEAFPSGMCAERSLLYWLASNRPDDPVEMLAIASSPSERECYPCGACRQVMVDTERRQGSAMKVVMYGNGTASVVDTAADLLPFTFIL